MASALLFPPPSIFADTLDKYIQEFVYMGPLHGHGEELIFQYPPLAVDFDHNAYVVTDDAQELLTPAQAYALKISDRANWAFLAYTARIQDVWHLLRSEIHASEKKDVLQSFLLQELARLDQYKGKKWEQLRYAAINGRHYFITDQYFRAPRFRHPAVTVAAITSLILRNETKLSRDYAQLQLRASRDLLSAAGVSRDVYEDLPLDVTTLEEKYNLNPTVRPYLCCPRCYKLFPLVPEASAKICDFQEFQESPCQTPLWRLKHVQGRASIEVPVLKVVHQPLKHWLGRLLARKGVEDLLDAHRLQSMSRGHTPVDIDDILDSRVFRGLTDLDGSPFSSGPVEEGRFVVSLAMDGFNPHHLSPAGLVKTTTGIWMVLLNFPPHLRYLEENMYLVVALPGKPSNEQINHALRQLVVEDLKPFRSPGVRFSRTYKYSEGRLVKLLVVPLVNDGLAARQAAGLTSMTSTHFCTFCTLQLSDLSNVNKEHWHPRSFHDYVQDAAAWLDADTRAKRDELTKETGIRYSALLELDYVNPLLFSIVDLPHTCYLGAFHHLCRHVLEIDVKLVSGDGTEYQWDVPSYPRPPNHDLNEVLAILRSGHTVNVRRSRLVKLKAPALYHVCRDQSLRYAGAKAELSTTLLDWYNDLETDVPDYPLELEEQINVPDPIPDRPENKALNKVLKDLRNKKNNPHNQVLATLSRRPQPSLLHVCRDNGLTFKGTRSELATRLINWFPTAGQVEDYPDDASSRESSVSSSSSSASGQRKTFTPNLQVRADVQFPLDAKVRVTLRRLGEYMDGSSLLFREDFLAFVKHVGSGQGRPELNAQSPAIQEELKLCNALYHILQNAKSTIEQNAGIEVLKYCCSMFLIELPPKYIKDDILELVILWREEHLPKPKEKAQQRSSKVLARDVMEEIWSDMAQTVLPPWIARAPPNWGTAERGKLSADEWKVICTIHLPATLIRLWGTSSDPRKIAMLDNLMDLVEAVLIINSRVITESHAGDEHQSTKERYERRIFSYLQGLKTLYPGYAIKPVEHMLGHLGDLVDFLGPNHARNSGAFERYIHSMQEQNTNMKTGDMESSFMYGCGRQANLQSLMHDDPELATLLKSTLQYRTAFKSRHNWGSKFTNLADPSETMLLSQTETVYLDARTRALLVESLNISYSTTTFTDQVDHVLPEVEDASSILLRGVEYTRKDTSRPSGSHIVFRRSSNTNICAGRILRIFRHNHVYRGAKRGAYYFEVEQLMTVKPLDDGDEENFNAVLEAYVKYNVWKGIVVSSHDPAVVLITTDMLVSHCALMSMEAHFAHRGLSLAIVTDVVRSILLNPPAFH